MRAAARAARQGQEAHGMTVTARILVLLLACFAAPGAVSAAFANETCFSCHKKEPRFTTNVHAATADCSVCHGAGKKHVRAPKKFKDIEVFKDTKHRAAAYNAVCLSCHEDNQRMMFWQGSAHARNDVACVDCHTVHTAGRDRAIQPKKCYDCHKSVRRDMGKPYHHPVNEEQMGCTSCHAVHGSLTKGMLTADSTNELCYVCHTDKRGPFRFAHPPVEENCLNCHTVHGSRHARLLTERERNLCQNCHSYASHSSPGSLTGDPDSSGGAFTRRASCLTCHGDVHGSNTSSNFR